MCLRGRPLDGWVTVVCTHCARSGRSRVARLIELHGADVGEIDLLRILTQSCRHQHDPGSGKRRKYVPACLATIGLPAPVVATLERPTSPTPDGVPYTIETWDLIGGGIELHLAVVYPLDMAHAAFLAACARWPTSEITVRQGARVLHRQERPGKRRADLPGGGPGP